jgi:hypothetical protein
MRRGLDARMVGRQTITYLVSVIGEALRTIPLDILDLLLVATVANFNFQRRKDPSGGARRQPGTRRGISRNAVSRTLNVPLETVRRRVGVLIAQQILVEQPDGLVFVTKNPMGLGEDDALYARNLELVRELFRGLKAAGVDLD